MLDSVTVLLRSRVQFIGVMLFLVLYNNNNSDVIINLAGLHLESGWINQQFPVFWGGVHSVQMSPPGGSWTLGRLQVDSRLIFGWVATKEKMVDGLRQTPGGVQLEYVGECKVLLAR